LAVGISLKEETNNATYPSNNDAPATLQLPMELHHNRLEIIIWPLYEQRVPTAHSFKSLLMKMPNVGNDNDFARQRDFGRRGETWDS
jgi:hypothetical protein